MTGQSPPQPRKRPKQERARLSVAAIEQACLKILEEEGPRRLTTNRIAEVAGVNIASLYQYFPNKDAVVGCVYAARVAAEADAIVVGTSWLEKLARHSLEEALQQVIRIEVEARRRLSRLDAEFYARYHRSFDLVREANRRAVAARKPPREEWLLGILACHQERLRVANLGLTCAVVTHALDGAMDYAVERHPELLESEAFQRELAALAAGLVEARPG